jgi:hypothetical protein
VGCQALGWGKTLAIVPRGTFYVYKIVGVSSIHAIQALNNIQSNVLYNTIYIALI